MKTDELFCYTIRKINSKFNYPPVKGEIRYSNGVFILDFQINRFELRIVTDRGFIEVYRLLDGEDTGLMFEYEQIANFTASPENIEKIIEFVYLNRNKIFHVES